MLLNMHIDYVYFNDLFLKMQEQLVSSQPVLVDSLLIELVNRIRPDDATDLDEINHKFQAFIQALLLTPHAVTTFQNFFVLVLRN